MIRYVFAYGTLVEGSLSPQVAAVVRRHCRLLGPATLPGTLFDLGAYPGARPATKGNRQIRGQVLEMFAPGLCLPVFDSYEGYAPGDPEGSLYRREVVSVRLRDQRLRCYVYWLNRLPRGARPISGGDWFARRRTP